MRVRQKRVFSTLTYRGLELAGNAATCRATVTVPHDRQEHDRKDDDRQSPRRAHAVAIVDWAPRGRVVRYRTTVSTRTRMVWGIVSPIALAVFSLTANSNWVGCSTGISAGLAPLAILSMKTGTRRIMATRLGP